MTDQLTVREVWESVRPLSEAAAIVAHAGLDVEELEKLEDKWNSETLPYLNGLNLEPMVRAEVARLVRFCEDRIKSAEAEYERNGRPFSKRRYLMEEKIPTARKFLTLYQGWRGKMPSIQWEPQDVVEIKRRGMKAFVRSNLERFYN